MDIYEIKSTSLYKEMTVDEIYKELETAKGGLSSDEVKKRIKIFGPNDIKEAKRNKILDFFKRYWGPMPWMLEFAIVLTIILDHYTESIIIFLLLTINAIIGYFQSQNSQKAVQLLKKNLEIKAKVFRDDKLIQIEAKEIVPGDIISIKRGDLIPADVKIIDGELSIDESALTGESLPKDIYIGDVIFSSSIVKRGEAKCAVVNTGSNTYFGKTVELVKIAKPKSKQVELMLNIVKYMMYLGIFASVVVSIYGLYIQKDILFILSIVVIFLIGAIPVALPAVLTIVQAVGAIELSKKGVLVTRLDSIEDGASIDIFCFDKTGTITQNNLTVVDSVAFGDYTKEDVIRMAALASAEDSMDAIDLSIINYAKKEKIDLSDYEKVSYDHFNPESKKTQAVVKIDGKSIKIIKGAAQTIMELCDNINGKSLTQSMNSIREFSEKGSRTIAIAVADDYVLKKYDLVGFLAIADPPRDDSKSMIEEIRSLGIKCLMLTGDSLAIAKEIAGQVGIGGNIFRMVDLEGLDYTEQLKIIEESDGFAEVYPEDKYNIVKLLQENGHVVGMTGDGVNDSPALKQADLGTAVSDATDVAKASASIVLTEPGLSEIIDTVKISRKTYQRMLTWVINKITKVVEVVVLFSVGFFWTKNIVISLLGMSLLVFANDFVTMSIATDNVKSTGSPNIWNIKNLIKASFLLGFFFALVDLVIIYIGLNYFQLDFIRIQTLVMLSLVFNTQFRILMVRERGHFWSSLPNKHLLMINILAIIVFVFVGSLGIFVPALALSQVLITLGVTFVLMIILDFVKYYIFRWFKIV
ncbi:MAG: H+-transporting ATPase [Fusobacteria bacterium]|nr:MAG: H+-transporting ATPase [Fusobacteriota bacterium]KAF0229187.1 MAG: H+-transporting [Fusobacteriota bacterium]